jgi:hypothetical protein
LNSSGSRLSFEPELGLDSFCSGKPHLVDDGKLGAGRVTKYGSSTILLCREIVAASRELASKERGFVLVREDKVSRLQLVHFEDTVWSLLQSGPLLRISLLLAKLAGGALGRMDRCGPHFHAELSNESTAAKPLNMLPP